MSDTDFETALKVALMRADLDLKTKQAFWETPRNLVIIISAITGITAGVAGVLGFKLGQQDRPQTIIIQQQPATIAH